MTIQTGDMFFFLIIKTYIRNIFQIYNISVGIIHNGILYLIKAFVFAAGFYIEGFSACMDITGGNISGFALNTADYIVNWNMLLRNFIEFQINTYNLLRHSPVLNFLQALYFFQIFL